MTLKKYESELGESPYIGWVIEDESDTDDLEEIDLECPASGWDEMFKKLLCNVLLLCFLG